MIPEPTPEEIAVEILIRNKFAGPWLSLKEDIAAAIRADRIAEAEACAKICDRIALATNRGWSAESAAAAIRERIQLREGEGT